MQTFPGVASGTFSAPDHEYPSSLELKLTAINSKDLTHTQTVTLQPRGVSLTFQSNPSGIPLIVATGGGTTPFVQTVIVGSEVTIVASPTQTIAGVPYSFAFWSDGGAASHSIIAGAAPATYSATYRSADLSVTAGPSSSEACAGGPLTYTLTAHNAGPTLATSVSITAALPAGASLQAYSGDGWTCSGSTTAVCTRASLNIGDAPALVLSVTAPPTAGSVSAAIAVSSATSDPSGSNNTAAPGTTVVSCAPALTAIAPTSGPASGAMAITATGDNFEAGATVTIGGVPASNVIVSGPTAISATAPPLPPGTLNDIVTSNPNGQSGELLRAYLADFSDVPGSYAFHHSIEKIFRAKITTGCGAGAYCPGDPVIRADMAVFLLRGKHGGNYHPPTATGQVFADVPAGSYRADWIEQLALEGITKGCTLTEFCPFAPVTRASMAAFLLRAKHAPGYHPPPATGDLFDDVPLGTDFGDWIEQLSRENITGGCGGGNYCPNGLVSRGQMAAFLSRTFGLP